MARTQDSKLPSGTGAYAKGSRAPDPTTCPQVGPWLVHCQEYTEGCPFPNAPFSHFGDHSPLGVTSSRSGHRHRDILPWSSERRAATGAAHPARGAVWIFAQSREGAGGRAPAQVFRLRATIAAVHHGTETWPATAAGPGARVHALLNSAAQIWGLTWPTATCRSAPAPRPRGRLFFGNLTANCGDVSQLAAA